MEEIDIYFNKKPLKISGLQIHFVEHARLELATS